MTGDISTRLVDTIVNLPKAYETKLKTVQGDSCELCTEQGKFQEEFVCDNSCNCSSIGTNGNTSVCQGVCISKTLFQFSMKEYFRISDV